MNKYLITIVGPTGIGKTSLSIQLAKHFNTEIISADSRQFFKEMSIGTAKPSWQEMDNIPHHFIDFISIFDTYTAGMFEKQGIKILSTLFEKNNTVILVGGSGLYVKALTEGIDDIPSDKEIRKQLVTEYEKKGIEIVQKKLKKLDPIHYSQMDIQNPQRVIRALEVCLTTGSPYSSFRNQEPKARPFNILKIGLTANRTIIYNRINQRVDEMIKNGLLEEAQKLHPYKYLNSLQTVGYKELFDYFENKLTKQEAIEKIKQSTRQFAKRQLTWFKKEKDIKWFDITETQKIIPYISTIMHK